MFAYTSLPSFFFLSFSAVIVVLAALLVTNTLFLFSCFVSPLGVHAVVMIFVVFITHSSVTVLMSPLLRFNSLDCNRATIESIEKKAYSLHL